MSAKHTQGPWTFGETRDDHKIIRSETRLVCKAYALVNRHEEAMNIKLISHAPDLLAAAADFLKYFERVSLIEVSSDLANSLAALRAAVAKATGEVKA